MTPKEHCQSCQHLGKAEGYGHCAYFTFAPNKHCTLNTCKPAASIAMRMAFAVERASERALLAKPQGIDTPAE